jgi:hypothetical protein
MMHGDIYRAIFRRFKGHLLKSLNGAGLRSHPLFSYYVAIFHSEYWFNS